MSLEREKVLSGLKKNVANVMVQIQTVNPSDQYSLGCYSAFLTGLEKSGELLAHSVNNTALAYRFEPSPTEIETDGLCKNIESRVVVFLNSFLAIPTNCGKYFLADVRTVCISTLQSCVAFVEDLIKANESVLKKRRKKLVLQETSLTTAAEVWEKGQESIKGLPKNNYAACSKFILSQLRLIADAISELDDARALVASEDVKDEIDDFEMDEFDLDWSEADLKLLGPATGLLKTVKNLVKKIGETAKEMSGKGNALDESMSNEKNGDLDRLCDICAKLSPVSDDLASTLYPPIDPSEVSDAATSLITISRQLLDEGLLLSVLQMPVKIKGLNVSASQGQSQVQCVKGPNENVKNWADFLANALKHNEEQLNMKLAERGLSIMTVADK